MNLPFPSGIYAILDMARVSPSATTGAEADALLLARVAEYAEAAAAAGAVALQLRWKSLAMGHPARARACAAAVEAVAGRVPVLCNDDLAAAVAAGVGLHLGQGDGDARAMRQPLGTQTMLGLSTHTAAQVTAARVAAVDYLGFGPVRATTSKHAPDPVTGLASLAAAVLLAHVPVVAIGGLRASDLADIRATGAHAAAVIGAWLGWPGEPYSPAEAGAAVALLHAAWHTREPARHG